VFLVKVVRQLVGLVPMVFGTVVRQSFGSCGLRGNAQSRPLL
jgi:hypothetical protein